MIEDDINSNQCRFCKSSFSDDILKKIKDDRNDVYCENCGDLIKRVQNKYNFNPTENIEKISNTNTKDTPAKPQKDLESNPDALHYPIGRIFYDKEFPLTFKSNFIIVFSRLTYFHALYLDSKGQIELGGMEVPENTINNLYMSIRHIQNKRIKSKFLNNLHEISKEEFERNLKQLQAKIQSNREYREDFIVYSRWLIKRVLMIVSEKKPNDQLTKFERTILEDLSINMNLINSKRELIQKGIKGFPTKSRLILCKTIYMLVENEYSLSKIHDILIQGLKQKEPNEIWLKELPNHELLEIKKKISDNNLDHTNYFQNLILIVFRLREINSKEEEPINIQKFATNLINEQINLNMKLGTLRFFLRDLINYLKKEIPSFKLVKKTKQNLFDDGKKKECARCHIVKNYTDFIKRKQYRVEYICKNCKLEVSAIRMFRNKLDLISEIFRGRFNNKCSECESDVSKLPVLEFHHPNQNLKEIQWSKNRHVNFKEIIRKLEADKVVLLCANCHSLRQSNIFNKYKDIILKKNLFQNSPEEIRQLLLNCVKRRESKKKSEQRSKIKYNILTWIKKRYVIEQLYQGKCVSCEKLTIYDNLPGFDFHHSLDNLESPQVKINKESTWKRIQTSDIDIIVNTLIEEECVAICSNCHRLIHARYFNLNVEDILDEDSAIIARDNYYKSIRNITAFKFNKKKIADPLKTKIKYGEIWKKYLILIYLYSKKKQADEFNSKELVDLFDIKLGMTNKVLTELKLKGLINMTEEKRAIFNGNVIIGQSPRKYQLTSKGINLAQELSS